MQPTPKTSRITVSGALFACLWAPCVWALGLWPMATLADLQATRLLEKSWRNAADLDGEVVTLSGGDRSFIAIHRPQSRDQALGAVVLLHGPGTNANSHEVIRPLRIGLSQAGWDTLSVQLPATYPGARPAAWLDNAEQINAALQAALDWLKQRRQLNQVVLTVGASGRIALRHAASAAPAELQAAVLVSASADFADPADADMLGTLKLRVLDVYAERDRPTVTGTAMARKRAARKAGATRYDQRTVAGAIRGFRAHEAQLLATVRAWLQANVAGTQISGRD